MRDDEILKKILEDFERTETHTLENSESLAKNAKMIFLHLPAGEIKDDEPIHYRYSNDVGLMVKRGPDMYWLERGGVVRLRITEAGKVATVFRDGKLIGSENIA